MVHNVCLPLLLMVSHNSLQECVLHFHLMCVLQNVDVDLFFLFLLQLPYQSICEQEVVDLFYHSMYVFQKVFQNVGLCFSCPLQFLSRSKRKTQKVDLFYHSMYVFQKVHLLFQSLLQIRLLSRSMKKIQKVDLFYHSM
ncbi:hypothetical protein MtrunA17_Chr8g0355851 [Medicago truncatula]|uniref:Transmembrane protein n=1 Tax=Medicago truncatula TaxID=3880 RepID=A0A396GJ13_MEDTR|nr:hypothetical protein MtrunA17_Chr8g0355851 [Medicago truncatula]